MTAVFTIIAKNYLPNARVLMRSVAEQHPEWQRFVILVDSIDGHFDPQAEDFEVVLSSNLAIPRSSWFHFKYTVLELGTAVKPYAFQYLLERYGYEHIIYLDPDIKVFSRMKRVADALASADIVLTPHLTAALDDDRRPTEIDILRAGTYNLGFIALRRSPETAVFLAWWQQRLYDHCVVDLARGLFVDQRWVDLVPGLFEGVAIIRDPGYNVAYWNLSHRDISGCESGYQVKGAPLCFFHFSGYNPDLPDQVSRHQNRHVMRELPKATQEIILAYRRELLEAGFAQCRKWPYAFGTFANGTAIPDLGRPIHHEMPELMESIEDPFSESGFQAFVSNWNAPVEDGNSPHPGISRLGYRIYRTRTDVQSAMPDIFGSNYRRFLEWMLVSGKAEHGLGDVFLATVVEAIHTVKAFQEVTRPPVLAADNEFADKPVSRAPEDGTTHLRLTRMARAIYESRSELQRYFPDPGGRDSAPFLVWLLTYGKKEHNLTTLHLAPMKAQWHSVVCAQPSVPRRLRYEMTLRAFAASAYARTALTRVSLLGRRLLRLVRPRPAKEVAIRPRYARPLEFGVNLVGYFQAETGVGQSVRSAYGALQAAEIPVARYALHDTTSISRRNHSVGSPTATRYSNNVFFVNADQTQVARRKLGVDFYRNCRSIGFWTWELGEFPDQWDAAFQSYSEIWTPSNFCRDAISKKNLLPVYRVPYPVEPDEDSSIDRRAFGLDPNYFTFLCAFDVLSVPERKNPLAAVRAFERAFPAGAPCQLIIKINHVGAGNRYVDELRQASQSGGAKIIDAPLTRSEMYALTRGADCIVSLHRSEGFGLLIAEGMYFKKPVIVTNYSGNTDFTTAENAMLVNYRLIPVGPGREPYSPQGLWADPDIDQAARYMSLIASDAELGARLAAKGNSIVRANLSASAVGRMMRERLEASPAPHTVFQQRRFAASP
jgi:glycosyltransferase involved in cell wall biosynthesis